MSTLGVQYEYQPWREQRRRWWWYVLIVQILFTFSSTHPAIHAFV
jgi:hypothetical protein